jgi:hypothetical protein
MTPGQTVINRFVEEVIAELGRRDAGEAGRRVYEVAAVFEPGGRAGHTEAEDRRLVLLADRAARHWVPLTLRPLPGSALPEMAGQQPPVRSVQDAADAAGRVREIRAQLRRAPANAGAAQPGSIATALAPIQKFLAAIGEGRSAAAEAQEARAIGWAARGLVVCFYASGTFADGLPAEVRATTTVLDALDDQRTASWGTRPTERTAHESSAHAALVAMLFSTLAMSSGEVTHADGSGTLPQPHPVGRHRPDVLGQMPGGDLFLGEAKLGPELHDTHMQEQLADFLGFSPDGQRVIVHLGVPVGWRGQAERAAVAAAGSIENLVVHEFAVPGAPEPA